MEYVKLGNTGLDISLVCLGCMGFGAAEGWVHNEWALDEDAIGDWSRVALPYRLHPTGFVQQHRCKRAAWHRTQCKQQW